MEMKSILKGLTLLSTCLLLNACANTGNPTHRWASTDDADKERYNADHANCQSIAQISSDQKELHPQSDAFQVYKQCMNNNGYVLTAYAD